MNDICSSYGYTRFRLRSLWAYYFPIIKWQLIIYAIVAVAFAVLELLPLGTFLRFSIFTMVWFVLSFLFMLAPLVFARNGDSRMVESQLPVTAADKLTFYALYLLVLIPALVFVLPEIAMWLSSKIPSLQNDLIISLLHLRWELPPGLVATNILTAVCGVMTCLCVVLKAKSNRTLKAVASVLAVEFTVGVMGGIYGMVSVFRDKYAPAKMETPHGIRDAINLRMQESVADVGDAWVFQLVIGGIMAVYLICIVRTIYKTLRRGGCCL